MMMRLGYLSLSFTFIDFLLCNSKVSEHGTSGLDRSDKSDDSGTAQSLHFCGARSEDQAANSCQGNLWSVLESGKCKLTVFILHIFVTYQTSHNE